MRSLGLVFLTVLAVTANASDVYVLQGSADTPIDGCQFYGWRGAVLLHNASSADAIVTLLGFGNTPPLPGVTRQFRVEAGRTAAAPNTWTPSPQSPTLWVLHLDIPTDVTIEGRIEIKTENCVGPPSSFPDRGKLSFPVYRDLQPSNVTKVHLGTDLASTSARNNVAVYNGGTVNAHAHVEVHRACDDQVIDRRDVDIEPSAVLQVTGLTANPDVGCLSGGGSAIAAYTTYVTVTVDQPSLSWVSTLANSKPISVVYGVNSSFP